MAISFHHIDGQTAVRDYLLTAVHNNHVSHALHFLGPEGSGNLSLALAFATYVLCHNPSENDACGSCSSCIKMAGIQHPDVHYVFPVVEPKKNTSVGKFMVEWRENLLNNPLMTLNDWMQVIADENKMGVISKDLALEIQQKISMKPFEGGYRIAIIWMPETMNATAANKLLKLLEEPPPKTLFLLVGNSADEMLPTILSRVQLVRVPRLSNSELEGALIDRYGLQPEKAKSLAFLSDGNLNMALKLSREEGGDELFFNLFRDWFRACYQQSDGLKRVALLDEFAALKREGQKSFLIYSLQMLRQCALATAGTEHLILVDKEALALAKNLGKIMNHEQQYRMSEIINKSVYHIERNASPKVLFMNLSIQIKNLFQY